MPRRDTARHERGRPRRVLPRGGWRLLVATAVALTLLLGAPPLEPPAEGAAVGGDRMVTITGGGYGHGRGMSQWGAQGAAAAGLDHRRILDFYYPGSKHETRAPRDIRVRLTDYTRRLDVARSGSVRVRDSATGATVTVRSSPRIRVVPDARGRLQVDVLDRSGTRWRALDSLTAWPRSGVRGPVTLSGPPSHWVAEGGGREREYRGSLIVHPSGSRVVVVNRLGLEEYLYGVVPREVPSWFEPAAVRAQAVAARSYAWQDCSRGNPTYDVLDTTSCQVYGGKALRSGGRTTNLETTTAAVDATRGQVLARGGSVLRTEFSASNGGRTVGSNGWPARDDPYDGRDARNTRHSWSQAVPARTIERSWPQVGTLRSVTVLDRAGGGRWGGRAARVELRGTAGAVVVTGMQLRLAAGLPSDYFEVRGDTGVVGQVAADGSSVVLAEDGGRQAPVELPTALRGEDPARWSFSLADNGTSRPDLVGVKHTGTGSRRVEVHVLSGASDYQRFSLHAQTPLRQLAPGNRDWRFAVGSLDGSGAADLFAIRLRGGASQRTEVHALRARDGYSRWGLQLATALHETDPDTTTFVVGDAAGRGDLTAVMVSGTRSGRTEVHTLSRSSGYRSFSRHAATALHRTDLETFQFSLGSWNGDESPDLFAFKVRGVGSGRVEVHVLDGRRSMRSWLAQLPTSIDRTSGAFHGW